MKLFPIEKGTDCEAEYVEVDDGAMALPSSPSPPPPPPAPLSDASSSPPIRRDSLAGLVEYHHALAYREQSLAAAAVSVSIPFEDRISEQPSPLIAGPQNVNLGSPSSPGFSTSLPHGETPHSDFSPNAILNSRKFSQDHAVGYNQHFHRHAHEIIPPPPPGASRRDPALNEGLGEGLNFSLDCENNKKYATRYSPGGLESPRRADLRGGDEELKGFLRGYVDFSDDPTEDTTLPPRLPGFYKNGSRRHPLYAERGNIAVPPKCLQNAIPMTPRYPIKSTRTVYEPSGMTMRELHYLRPKLSKEFLLIDTESRERCFNEACEAMGAEEMKGRLAVCQKEVARREKLVALLLPLTQHARQRAKAERREAKERAKTMRQLKETYHRPVMEVVVNEVHSQLHGLEALRAQWAQELMG